MRLWLAVKRILKAVYGVWLKVAHAIGRVNTLILLTLSYFIFFGIPKLLCVLLRKDFLDSRWRDRPSYWRKKSPIRVDRETFLKPY